MLDKHDRPILVGDWVTFYVEPGIPESVVWHTGHILEIRENEALVCDGDPRVENWLTSGYRRLLWVAPHAIQRVRR